jgi:hypothetical protein
LFLQAAKLSMSTRHMKIHRIAFFIFIIIPLRIFVLTSFALLRCDNRIHYIANKIKGIAQI